MRRSASSGSRASRRPPPRVWQSFISIAGRAQAKLGDTDAALVDFDEAVLMVSKKPTLDARDSEVFAQRGALYMGSGNALQAIEDYNQALKLDPRRN